MVDLMTTDLAIVVYDGESNVRLPGALVELAATGYFSRFGTSNEIGNVLFQNVAWADMKGYPYLKVSKTGYLDQMIGISSQSFLVEVKLKKESVPPPSPPSPPIPAPAGGMGHCSISSYDSKMGTLYRYGRSATESLGSGYTSYQAAEYSASLNAACQLALPIPTPAVTQVQLDTATTTTLKQIESTGSMLLNIIASTATTIFETAASYTDSLFASLQTRIHDFEIDILGKVQGLSDAILWFATIEIPRIWTSIDEMIVHAEEEATAWRKGVLDLETGIKSWIEASLFELLMKNLNAGAIEYKKKRGG